MGLAPWRTVLSASLLLASAAGASELTIDDAVAEALRNNTGLLAEKLNIGIAAARLITARLRPNPVFSAGGDHIDILGRRFTGLNGGGPTELNMRTDLTLERGGKRERRTEVAREARSVAELNYQAAARGIVLDTQNSFLDALLARDTLTLARENQGTLDRIVEINEARLRAGDIAKVELIRSRLAALQFRNSVRQGELRLRTALTKLAKLVGRDPGSVTAVAGEFRRDPAMLSLPELQESARRLRPDLLALRGEVARAGAEHRLQLAGAKSDYTVGTEYRRQQGINGKSNSLGFFVEVPLRLFDRNQGEVARAQVEQRQAELRVRAQERAVAAEVETAYQQYVTARDLLNEIEGAMVEQARSVREITSYSYTRGDATLLELLDAQRAFNETIESYNEARAEFARALYLIDSVSGKAAIP